MTARSDATGLSTQQLRRLFDRTWSELEPIGRDPSSGGYRRLAWSAADLAMREWFRSEATRRGLEVETDRNGNQWAWWGPPRPGSIATGSHLDSVPGGGAFDGPLGVVSAFLAIDVLRSVGVAPTRSLAVINFFEEEGGRYGIACLGSRLMTGAADPDRVRALTDDAGETLAEGFAAAGVDPGAIGPDTESVNRIAAFVELHIEQGRWLADTHSPVGVATSIWPHGRWHFGFTGEGNHAGTTALTDRRDPMLPFAATVLASRRAAQEHGAVATFGRLRVDPNGTNAVPVRVDAWLDSRAAEEETVTALLRSLQFSAEAAAAEHGVGLAVTRESWTARVEFDAALRERLVAALDASGITAPLLPTAAGHDAGILAASVPTAMLFVRNPSGVSHSPRESASESDCVDGVQALATALQALLTEAASEELSG